MSPIVTLEQKKTDIIELKALRPVLEHSQLNPEKCKTAIKFAAPPPPLGPNQSQGVCVGLQASSPESSLLQNSCLCRAIVHSLLPLPTIVTRLCFYCPAFVPSFVLLCQDRTLLQSRWRHFEVIHLLTIYTLHIFLQLDSL